MNVTDATQVRLDLGVERFLAGDSLAYHGVVFCWDSTKQPAELTALSYSDWIVSENVKRDEARQKIERSKAVATGLAERSAAFNDAWRTARKRFEFCLDTGNAAVLLAVEVDGVVEWIAA